VDGGIVVTMTNERRWKIEPVIGVQTREVDPDARYGRRRRQQAPTTKLTASATIDGFPWRALYEVETVDGRPAIREIRLVVVADPQLPPIDPRPLIVPSEALAEVRAALSIWGKREAAGPFLRMHGVEDLREDRPAPRKDRPEYFYAVIASLYDERSQAESGSPIPEVVERMGLECPEFKFSAKTVPNWILKARDLGLLESASGTRPGGRLTPHGRKVRDAGPPPGYNGPELAY
jgi:hypothetical protein